MSAVTAAAPRRAAGRRPWLKRGAFTAAFVPLASILLDAARRQLGADPVAEALNRLGLTALVFLVAALACTPLRLVVPWKYGFKGIKSIVKIRLVETQPPTTWNLAAPHEYGFYANVNPAVDHPRWSQATERRIGELKRRATLPFNGYAEQVAGLYAGMDLAVHF